MAEIYLVRHAESVANTKGIYQGQTFDTPLSALGKKQADALASRLRDKRIARLVTSPLTRTRQTAEAIVRWHNGLNVDAVAQIIETNHGEWEGVDAATIKTKWPEIFATWQNQPSRAIFPNGEAFGNTRSRVLAWWREFVKTAKGKNVVIGHDNILRVLITDVLGLDPDSMWRFELQPAAITILKVDNGRIQVKAINDTNHLEGLQANLANHAL